MPERVVWTGAGYVRAKGPRHWHRMCPACREARRRGCICPEQHPTVVWDDCPVHGAHNDGSYSSGGPKT